MADDIKNIIPEGENELPDGIIELTDEDGVTTQFEYLATIEHEEELYVVLMAMEEDGEEGEENDHCCCDEEGCCCCDDDEGEVLILKIEKDPESGEDMYVSVEDDAVCQAVFDKFMAMMEEEEDQ